MYNKSTVFYDVFLYEASKPENIQMYFSLIKAQLEHQRKQQELLQQQLQMQMMQTKQQSLQLQLQQQQMQSKLNEQILAGGNSQVGGCFLVSIDAHKQSSSRFKLLHL